MQKPEADPHGTMPHSPKITENPYCIPTPDDNQSIQSPSINLDKVN
jgi:hypothetical protein